MIDEDALTARLTALGPLKDAGPILELATPALRSRAETGDWVDVRFPRAGAEGNPEKSRELDRALEATLEDDEAGPDVALQALCRAIAAELAAGGEAKLSLGGDSYELKLHTPTRGGRAKLRLRNPDAAPADDAEEAEAVES